MPIYEYRCPNCGARFEELVLSAEAESQVACPKCGQRRVERQFSVFAAHAAAVRTPGGCASCDRADGGCPWASKMKG